MFEQYPDSITITVTTAPTEVNGVYSAGTSTNHSFKCRAEENGSGRKLTGVDGQEIDFAFTCYMPAMTTQIPEGSVVALTKLNNAIIRSIVKRAVNGQLNSRIWV